VASLGPKGPKVPPPILGRADVRGALSREVIQRVIRRHVAEVRHCYEQALTSRPDLQGRVAVKFVIAPSGAVQTAVVEQSALGHAGVEACITRAVTRWAFPAPEGGGIVIVSYPFTLAQSGR
jgi:TonB family protein